MEWLRDKLKEIPQEVIVNLRGVKDDHKLITLAYRRTTSRRVGYRRIAEAFESNPNTIRSIVHRVYAKAWKRHVVLEKEKNREGRFAIIKETGDDKI